MKSIAIDARLAAGTATGDSTYWTGLIHGLAEIAADDPLLFFSNTSRPPEIPWSSTWRWIFLPAKSQRWWSLVSFPLAARRAGAGVVHTQYNLSPLVRRGGVITVHDVSFFIGPQWFGKKDRLLLQRFVPASAKRSSKVIAVSETCRREIEQWIPAARGKTVVTPEAPAPWIHPVEPEIARTNVAEKLGVKEPYLFTLGTDWARKNQSLAVAAVEGVPSAPLLCVAGKSSALASSDRVKHLGYVPQELLSDLYSGAVAHILPSLHEGFGLTVLEAFWCGCPVLCGMGGALPEVAGGAAKLVPTYEPADWSQALKELLSSNLGEFKQLGRQRAAEFSWAATARLTRQVYLDVVRS